jgi:trehalose 6-phosphate phosphatase
MRPLGVAAPPLFDQKVAIPERELFIDAVTLPSRAVLLDVDGTILDLAPTPLEVVVPADLTVALERLSKRVGGALAFVSGRPLAELDLFFAPLKLPSIAGHGAEVRLADGTVHRATTFLDPQLKAEIASIADERPGVLVEDKGYSIAIHYRQVPHLGHEVRDEVSAICARFTSARLEILPGKSVVEVKQPSFNKGTAVRDLMQHAPFKGRTPIFIGDDVTDEAAFEVLPEFNGVGFSVGREVQGIAGMFEAPSDVRRWIAEMVRTGQEKR